MKTVIIAIATATLMLVFSCCACCSWFSDIDWTGIWQPNGPDGPQPTPNITRDPLPPTAEETQALLESTVIPVRDLHELAVRLRGLPASTPRTINPQGTPDYHVGDRRSFYVSNVDTDEQFEIHAVLQFETDHVYMWVEEGVSFDADELAAAARLFESQTYPTNRSFFGSEWNPGVDNDPHLSILHARNLGNTVAGYYSSADEFVSAVRDDSNEMEMFYINIENVTLNDDFYNGVLAHEFQHMIHWYNDRNEDTWLNEGFSELAMYLNNYDVGGSDYSFSGQPDTQLNSWPEGPGAASANYGAGYLFTSYFLDEFGPDATQALVASDENGLAAVDAVLAELGSDLNHVDLFASWVVANVVDEPAIADGQYGYSDINPPRFRIEQTLTSADLPFSEQFTVHQYGVDYVELQTNRPLRLSFTGSTQIGLLDAQPHSGQYLFWSNRSDDSNMTLTRAFDLSGVQNATLQFWTWYHLEEDWDYAYVEVSTDDGATWQILTTPSGTPANPNGNSFGWGYTGSSNGWIQEEIDLSPYAGQPILLRFEYITDDAVNQPGFVIDDVTIPEIGYSTDFESDEDGWQPDGFIRHANVLPQRWIVQLITFGRQTTVERLELAEEQSGQWSIPLDSSTSRAVVAISAYAPVTTEPASYALEVEEE